MWMKSINVQEGEKGITAEVFLQLLFHRQPTVSYSNPAPVPKSKSPVNLQCFERNPNCLAVFFPLKNRSDLRKTLAAMALLFAVQAFQQPPFMVLDEVIRGVPKILIWNQGRAIFHKEKTIWNLGWSRIQILTFKKLYTSFFTRFILLTTNPILGFVNSALAIQTRMTLVAQVDAALDANNLRALSRYVEQADDQTLKQGEFQANSSDA